MTGAVKQITLYCCLLRVLSPDSCTLQVADCEGTEKESDYQTRFDLPSLACFEKSDTNGGSVSRKP